MTKKSKAKVQESASLPALRGRPSDYSEKTAGEICRRIADGESLRTICKDKDMPTRSTVHLWLLKHASFSDQYARARVMQADAFFDDVCALTDDLTGRPATHEEIQAARLRVDTLKWAAGKLRPKKYNDKLIVESNGGDGKRSGDAIEDLSTHDLEQMVLKRRAEEAKQIN